MNREITAVVLGLSLLTCSMTGAAEPTKDEAAAALKKAVTFFQDKVSIEGGYLWRYSEDLSLREGETAATATQAWVQPPGTPSVGEALLAAFERTQDKYLLDSAVRTARALVKGQLASGGWGDLPPDLRQKCEGLLGGLEDKDGNGVPDIFARAIRRQQ